MSEHISSVNIRRMERQQLIINKTLKLIAKKGLDHVSIADIAHATQLGHGQIYRNFKDKRDIFKNVIMSTNHKRRLHIRASEHNLIKVADNIGHAFIHELTEDEIKLTYETLKLNPEHPLFSFVNEAEKNMMDTVTQLLSQQYPHAELAEIRAASEMIASLSEGILVRKMNGFTHDVECDLLSNVVLACLEKMDEMLKKNSPK